MKSLVLVVVLLALAACSKSETAKAPGDFKVTKMKAPLPAWQRPTDCRENIRQAICLVDQVDPKTPGSADENSSLTRPCDPVHSIDYVPAFEALYDSYPPQFQKMFCSLRRIFVERGFFGSAYAGSFTDSDGKRLEGAVIGVRQSLIEHPFSISAWASWKEQLNFGGDPKDYALKLPFPKFEIPGESSSDFMSFVFAHEFGHLFDFKNNVNQFKGDPECFKTESCPAVAGTWTSLSWSTESSHSPTSRFSNSSALCFYDCKTTLSPALIPDVYEAFFGSNFISTYSSTNPYDDFAEMLAYYYLRTTLKKSVLLSYSEAKTVDATDRLQAPALKEKLDYVEKFLRESPQYP
jgi:hypothetical protein